MQSFACLSMDSRLIPDNFGDYVTLRDQAGAPIILGSGGFGTTICASRSRLLGGAEIRDDCAIKILHHQAIQDPKRRSQFVSEILALRDLAHPNLVRYVDCGERDGLIYLVMELCRGGDLERFVTDWGPFGERAALSSVLQVSEGLKEAHRKNYLHRDLKPRNVLLLESVPPTANLNWFENAIVEGRLCFKVVDFGLAGRLGGDVRTSGFAGSPMFCSPEQVRERELDFRSDIYSLGMTLWYLVAGCGPLVRPDGRPVEDSREAMKAHTSPVPHDNSFPKRLSPEFRDVLSRMVRKSPDERFSSLQDLIVAIRQVLSDPGLVPDLGAPVGDTSLEPTEPSLVDQPEWAAGECDDFFLGRMECGRRSVGKFYRATSFQTKRAVGLTAWVPGISPDAMSEHQLAEHLQRIKRVTSSALAPMSLTAISEVRRTAGEWCVAEEWQDGVPLEDLIARRGRSLSIEEIALVLAPVAEAADFLLRNKIDTALLTISDIRLCGVGSSTADRGWLEQPVERWENLNVQVSALTIPSGLAGQAIERAPVGGTIASSFSGSADASYTIGKSFCRLFYRMVEGSEVAGAADWDEYSYIEANRLSAASNVLLRRAICGAEEVESVSGLLRRICANEGVYRISSTVTTRVGRTSTTSDTRESTASQSEKLEPMPPRASVRPPEPVAPVVSQVIPPIRVSNPGVSVQKSAPIAPAPSVVNASISLPPEISRTRPTIAGPTMTMELEVARLVPGLAGMVRSPYGERREQRVSGPNWRGDARIYCEETSRLFKLPRVLPPLEAELIEGRYDAVISPYVEPRREVPVPLGRWKPEEEITCGSTGLPILLPSELPAALGSLISGKPGFARSPYGAQRETAIPPEEWRPNQRVTCAESAQTFFLPAALPALHAIPTEVPGCFTSPYAPEERFTLQPHECVAGFEFECPSTEKPLMVSTNLPAAWKFEGRVRQGAVPEAQSPFTAASEPDRWQALAAAQWKPEAVIRCAVTGKEFVLPGELPALSVKIAPSAPAVLSPFAPHDRIPVAALEWQAGAKITLQLPGGVSCQGTLPEGDLPPVPAIAGELAGTFDSPFCPGKHFSLAPWDCIPDAAFPCPFTRRPLVLPSVMPSDWKWEAVLRQRSVPEARSPFIPESDAAETDSPDQSLAETQVETSDDWQPIAASEWKPGLAIRCRATGRQFYLPAELPVLHVEQGPVAPSILSPFRPHEIIAIPPASWRRTVAVQVRLPSGVPCRVVLPDDVLPLGRAELADLPLLPLGFDPQLRARRGAIRSPHGEKTWVDVANKDWLPGARLICPTTQQPFWLPAELPPLEARIGSASGSVWSPYTDTAVQIPANRWNPGEAIRCAETGGWFVLPAELPLLIGRTDERQPGMVESPFAPGEFFRAPVDAWRPGNAILCPQSKRKFALPAELPEWLADVEVVAPALGMVRSPYGARVAFKVPGEQWAAGGIINCAQTTQRARLPDDLPPMDAVVVESTPGVIQTPYTERASGQKISRSEWKAGRTIRCAATGRPLRLPDTLPALNEVTFPTRTILTASAVALAVLGLVAGGYKYLHGKGGQPLTLLPDGATPKPGKLKEWPKTFTFLDGIRPPPATVALVADNVASWDVKPHMQGVTVEFALDEPMADKRFLRANALSLVLAKPGYVPKTVAIKRGESVIPEMVPLVRETGAVSATSVVPPAPFYSAARLTMVAMPDDTPADETKPYELPLGPGESVVVKTGRYRVELVGPKNSGGVTVSDRKLVEIMVKASPESRITIPRFDIPKVLSGYTTVTWENFQSYIFRSLDAPKVAGTLEFCNFNTWSAFLLRFDPDFTKGELYETNGCVSSALIVGALNNLIAKPPDKEKDLATAKAKELLEAINLPASAEGAQSNIDKALSAFTALRALDQKNSGPSLAPLRSLCSTYAELMAATKTTSGTPTVAWQHLMKACIFGGAVSDAELAELSKPLPDGARGYLVRSPFKVIQCLENGDIRLSIQRHRFEDDKVAFVEWSPVLHLERIPSGGLKWKPLEKWNDAVREFHFVVGTQ